MKDDSFYIEGIKEHLETLKSYIPKSKNEYLNQPIVQDAVLMRLVVIGEEIGRLSDTFKNRHPDIQWYKITGLRNRVAHGYFEVDQDIIWETLTDGSLKELESIL